MLQKLQFQVNIFLWSIVAYLLSVAFTLAPLLIIWSSSTEQTMAGIILTVAMGLNLIWWATKVDVEYGKE